MTDLYKEFLDELDLCYKTETFSSSYDTEILWLPESSSLFIRGTDSPTDWIINCFCVPDEDTGFHSGFMLKAYSLIHKCQMEGLQPTTIVGHSAGGAVAQIVGAYFNVDVYSLACPKVIWENFDNPNFDLWANKKLVIINQKKDWISYLPPFFKHPVEPLWLDTEDYFLFAHSLIAFE